MTADPLPKAADAEHLTEALRRSGSLGEASVCNVAVMASFPKLRSHTFRLRLQYEGPAQNAPSSLILKMGRLDRAGYPSYANRCEIAFYRDIASDLREQVVPLCFETVDATENTTWHRCSKT
jgi:hypothetical protein